MRLWSSAPHHEPALEEFRRLMAMNSDVVFYAPSPILAPWHIQAEINGITLDFWPHKLKGRLGHEKSKQGYVALQRLIGRARAEEKIDLIE